MKACTVVFGLLAWVIGTGCGSPDPEDSAGNGSFETCGDCVGTNVAAPGQASNPTVSCEATSEQFLCSCLDQMGTSHDVYLSEAGCF